MSRTPGGLVLLDGGGGNGHPSASQRREQMLQIQLAQGAARENHYLTLIAYLVMAAGGTAVIPAQALGLQYDIGFGKDAETNALTYTASLHVEVSAAGIEPLPDETQPIVEPPPPEPEKEPTQ
jgi:hypothetical protein